MQRDEIEQVVRREVGQVLNTTEAIPAGESLATYGLDSLRSVELTLCLEDAFELVFDDEEISLENFGDVASIVELLDTKLADRV
jgi:acyl carrier protein